MLAGPATFVVGGSLGLADEVKEAAHELLSLSGLTLPHQLARVVLAEQLFRGLKIARGGDVPSLAGRAGQRPRPEAKGR